MVGGEPDSCASAAKQLQKQLEIAMAARRLACAVAARYPDDTSSPDMERLWDKSKDLLKMADRVGVTREHMKDYNLLKAHMAEEEDTTGPQPPREPGPAATRPDDGPIVLTFSAPDENQLPTGLGLALPKFVHDVIASASNPARLMLRLTEDDGGSDKALEGILNELGVEPLGS